MYPIVSTKRFLIVASLVVALLCVAPLAYAYDETNTGRACIGCHGVSEPTSEPTEAEPSGPHGGYTTATNKCATCHSVHKAAADGTLLLPAATVLATCETCHDGTGGQGVYGVIKARTAPEDPNFKPASSHSMLEPKKSIPGGNALTGGSRDNDDEDWVFSGSSGGLTCTDCHSPHGANVVAPFTGDRARSATDTAGVANVVSSTRLLKQRPTSMDTELDSVTVYGSDWCGACHAGRLSYQASGHKLNNHPVESRESTTNALIYTYENVVYSGSTAGTLGHNNAGYVMLDDPNRKQDGRYPICQQCHEDARDVDRNFTITDVDGNPDGVYEPTDNPRFQVFPHESDNPYLLIEEKSSLCTNCHDK